MVTDSKIVFSNCEEAEVGKVVEDDNLAAWLWAVSEKWTRLNVS